MEKLELEKLPIHVVQEHRLWKFVPPPERRVELHVTKDFSQRPRSLKDRVVATEVTLNNGTTCWALIEGVDVTHPEFSRHWMQCRLRVGSRWWRLARYHDHDAKQRSPERLASLLKLTVGDVFPIRFDLSGTCSVGSDALRGEILAELEQRLPRAEIVRMAIPKIAKK